MSADQVTIPASAEPILPRGGTADRPLFFVLMILVFLACLSAIAANAGFRAAGGWNADLRASASIQIPSGANAETQTRILEIAQSIGGVSEANALTRADSEALLQPWLGSLPLPEDLPVPSLIALKLTGNGDSLAALETALKTENIDAQIDDHGRWSADIRRAAKAVQIIATIALVLLMVATSAAAGFATQSGMAARQIIINVLQQVGASPSYIARLFIWRFGKLGAAAGAAGAVLAIIIALLFWLMSGRGDNALIPSFRLDFGDIFILLAAPILAAIICAIAAGLTAKLSIDRQGF